MDEIRNLKDSESLDFEKICDPFVLQGEEIEGTAVLDDLYDCLENSELPVYVSEDNQFPGGKGPYKGENRVETWNATKILEHIFGSPAQKKPNIYVYQLTSRQTVDFCDRYPLPYALKSFGQNNVVRSIWIGMHGNVTPPHSDGLSSNLLSQLHGKKRVWLWRPERAKELGVRGYGRVHSRQVMGSSDEMRKSADFVACIEPSQSVFMPGGWIHEVETLSSGVSISNFFGRPAAEASFFNMLAELQEFPFSQKKLFLHLLGWESSVLDEVDPIDWSHLGRG